MSIPAEEDCILFDMHCKMGIKKTYKLEVEECEPLQAVYAKEACPNRMQVQAQTLNLCLQNFQVCSVELLADSFRETWRRFLLCFILTRS